MAEKKPQEFSSFKKILSSKVVSITLWVVLIVWIGICVTDFIRAKQENKPIFTFASNKTEYVDGDVTSYTGLGYKIYFYERDSHSGVKFGPFWAKDESAKK